MNLTTRRGREHFRGVQRYSWPIRRWMIRTGPANLAAVTEAIAWKPDGIIMQVSDLRMIPILQDSGIPVVDVSGRFAEQPFARVESDNPAIGRMAAEHFLSKGFRNLGYLGDSTSEASQLREEGFRRRLQEAGLTASVRTLGEGEEIYQQWGEVQPAIEQWLRGLRKPVGVFAYDDQFAVLASQACIRAGLSVPEQVALLGVENDDVLCHHGYPPLSSVQTAQEQGGFEAARLLDRLMAGRAAARSSLLLAPLRVVERASTDILAIGDADVAAAVRFINEHATERINVGDVVAAVPVSRRVLESRFHKAMGRTILEELHRVRVERVKQLLQTSSDSMRRIAKATGFRNDSHLWVVFKKLTRISPRVYRHRAEVSDAAEERPQPPA
ncbi:MAG: DNA-binding transcriptional regulator [Planctomycetia bacterium]|nr:DNA-binding transcriptional regulator [Planctomycetia bacterium]